MQCYKTYWKRGETSCLFKMERVTEMTEQLLLAGKPFYFVCKLFGLMPFTLDARTATLTRSLRDIIFATITSLLQLICACASLYFALRTKRSSSAEEVVAVISFVQYLLLSLIVVVADNFCNRNKYEKILRLLVMCDRCLVAKIGRIRTSPERFVKVQLSIAFLLYCLMFSILLTPDNDVNHKLSSVIGLNNFGTAVMMLLRFTNLQLIIRNRLSLLNTCLINMIHRAAGNQECSDKRSLQDRGVLCTPDSVRSLSRGYVALCELSVLVTSVHQTALMLYLAALSSVVIVFAYNIASQPPSFGEVDYSAIRIVWFALVYNVSTMAVFLVPAHQVSAEAARTVSLCSQLLLTLRRIGGAHDHDTHAEVRLLAQHASLARPTTTLLGVLTLDLGVVSGFISVVTTYTALLLTFFPSGSTAAANMTVQASLSRT